MHIRHTIAMAAALAIAALSGVAQAQTVGPLAYGSPIARQIVRFGDLDPSTEAGAKRLAFRIRIAAQAVCGGDDLKVRFGAGFERCVSASLQQAAGDLNNSMVSGALGLTPSGMAYAHR